MTEGSDYKPDLADICDSSTQLSETTLPNLMTRRKAGNSTVFISGCKVPRRIISPFRMKSSSPPLQRPTQDQLQVEIQTASIKEVAPTVQPIASRFSYILKRPLSFLLVLWALAAILNAISISFRAALSPMCSLPLISRMSGCHSVDVNEEPRRAEYPILMEIQNNAFAQLLDNNPRGSSLAMEITNTEAAIEDLITVVGLSDLRNRDKLVHALSKFVVDAQTTARGLQTLNAEVNSAADM